MNIHDSMIYRLIFRFNKCKNDFSQVLNWDLRQVVGGGGSGQGWTWHSSFISPSVGGARGKTSACILLHSFINSSGNLRQDTPRRLKIKYLHYICFDIICFLFEWNFRKCRFYTSRNRLPWKRSKMAPNKQFLKLVALFCCELKILFEMVNWMKG